jgi:type IV secretion system protein VirD4
MAKRRVIAPADFERMLPWHILRGLGSTPQPVAARWATQEEINTANWRFEPDTSMLFLGYRHGNAIGRADDRHQITIGGSRSGKFVSLIAPVMLTLPSNVICCDPKGELAKVTASPREKLFGHRCVVLDPFKVSGRTPQRFNPLLEIKREVPELPDEIWPHAIDDAAALADALIQQTTSEAHWSEAAKSLLQALILMVLPLPEEHRTLGKVRDILMLRDPSILSMVETSTEKDKEKALFAFMESETQIFGGMVAGIGAQFKAMGDRERGSILSSARTQTAFLDSDNIKRSLASSDFALSDLKLKPTTVYLCLPASAMGTHARWLRLIITMALREMERIEYVPPLPVLFLCDEASSLGYMRQIEVAAAQMAGFGVKLWTVWQDIGQIKQHYKEGWETFFGNSAIATFHGISDLTTLEYLSKRLGTLAFKVPIGTGAGFHSVAAAAALQQENLQTVQLAATHELEIALARERQRMIVLFSGSEPIILQRAFYYDDPFFLERMR